MDLSTPTIVLAPDSFKESLSSIAAAEAMAQGVKAACPRAQIDCVPMADGGEGTVQALVWATNGTYCKELIHDPLGRPTEAAFGLLGSGDCAVIEMAAASGLALVSADQRNPLLTSTRGTGELILAALKAGVTRIILGIGGSATVDGGTGMARALGVRFLDSAGNDLPEGGGSLVELSTIDVSGLDPRIQKVQIDVACDVNNPLTGPRGAAHVFGPQKGATPAMVEQLEQGLAHLGRVIAQQLGKDVIKTPGSGTAGGLGAALMVFLDGRLTSGVDLVIKAVRLADRLKGADLCLTGEGKLDYQSASGKAVMGVGRLAKSMNVPVIVLAGTIGSGAEHILDEGIVSYHAIKPDSMSLPESIERTAELLSQTAEHVVRDFFSRVRSRKAR
ncbi:MAG: glycerate kinase [Actinobacteria bacterium]|nr:glycerate kinase [Actinomycetota bacterium]